MTDSQESTEPVMSLPERLVEEVRAAKKASAQPAAKVSALTLKVNPGQLANINAALEKAKAKTGAKSRVKALMHILQNFLHPEEALRDRFKVLSVGAVLKNLKEAFPDKVITATPKAKGGVA